MLVHPHVDQLLVESVVELGCLPPAFTREKHPGFFTLWEDRANEVLRLAGLLPAGRSNERLEIAKRACNSYTGHPLPVPIRTRLAALRRADGRVPVDAILEEVADDMLCEAIRETLGMEPAGADQGADA